MIDIYLINGMDRAISVTGNKGGSWGPPDGYPIPVPKTAKVKVGSMEKGSNNWGWLFLSIGGKTPAFQIYVATGSSGPYDYAIQWYDRGLNTSGGTIAQTTAVLDGDDVTFSLEIRFDPWMTRLRDIDKTKAINRITIPGTHDSGTLGMLSGTQCQKTRLEDQLAMGVRYFDIRLDSGTDDLRVVHGSAQGSGNSDIYWFSDVANICRDFLTGVYGFESTEETIFMQVKSDRGPDPGMHTNLLSRLNVAFADHMDRLYLKPLRQGMGAIPTLDDLKGRLVLIRRYLLEPTEAASTAGTDVHSFASGTVYNKWSAGHGGRNWIDDYEANKFEWPDHTDNIDYFHGSLIDYRNRDGQSFVIQDWFNTSGTEKKYELVEKYLDISNKGGSPDSWFINFSSCASPETSADVINPLLEAFFNKIRHPLNGYGTVLMDFVNPDLVEAVYGSNFPET